MIETVPENVKKLERRESASPTKQPKTPKSKSDLRNVTNPWEADQQSYVWDENTPPPAASEHQIQHNVPPTPASVVSKYSTPLSQARPIPEPRQPLPIQISVTKESQLARQAYLSAIDPAFGEILAQTGDPTRREALAQLAQAWSAVNQIDPEGEWALLSCLVDRLSNNQRLSTSLGIRTPSSSQTRQEAQSQSPRKTRALATDTGIATPTPSIEPSPVNTVTDMMPPPGLALRRANTTTNAAAAPSLTHDAPSSPRKQSQPAPATAVSHVLEHGSAGPKLVLSRNNPHLKSHRRRQSAFVTSDSGGWAGVDAAADTSSSGKSRERSRDEDRRSFVPGDERKLPGYVEKGMEHQGMLADSLYGRWIEGLKGRWAVS